MKTTAIIEEDWMYFKQKEDDNWMLKYCRFQPPFFFVYKDEDLKRAGKPDIVLIINENLSIHKTNDRIAYCGFLRLKQKFSTTREHWSVITRDGYIVIGKLYHVDRDGNREETVSPRSRVNKFGRKSKKSKSQRRRSKSRQFSVGTINDFGVIATKEHDDIQRIYKWDITNVMIIHSGSPEVVVELRSTKEKLAQLRFSNKEQAAAFTNTIRYCGEHLEQHRAQWSKLHPNITGIGKPLFPLQIHDCEYDKHYFFISLNCDAIHRWYQLLRQSVDKGIEASVKPLIHRLQESDSSAVNLDCVDEIYDFISRDLNKANRVNCKINNLPVEKRLLILHMNAISNSFDGVCYWIAILENAKHPKHALTLFQKHIDKQAVKKAKFIQEFVENDGLMALLSVLSIQNKQEDIDAHESLSEVRTLLGKVFESIASAPPFNESITTTNDQDQFEAKQQSTMHLLDITDYDGDTMQMMKTTSKTIQIRYKSGADSIFDSEQKQEVIFELVTSIWGFHETEILQCDLSPCTYFVKCLFTLCLLKPEFASHISTVLLDSTDLGKEYDNWWYPITRTMQNALDLLKSATTIFSGTGNMFIIQDKCKRYIFALLTLIVTMIDSFEIKDRIIERRLLDAISFNDLLYQLQHNMNDEKMNAIIELYKSSKMADINELTYSQMEISHQFLDDLRDRTISNGFHQYLSNILKNMASFPDSEEAWKNVDQYVYYWCAKFDDDIGITDRPNSFKSVQEVQQMDKEQVRKYAFDASHATIQNLQFENGELNAKYQAQLTKNNELQELLHKLQNAKTQAEVQVQPKQSVIIDNDKETAEPEAQVEQKQSAIIDSDTETDKTEAPAQQRQLSDEGTQLPPINAQDEEMVQKYKKQFAMKVPKPAIIHKLKFKDKKPHLIPYVFPEETQESDIDVKPQKQAPLNAQDEETVLKYKKQFAMKVPKPAIIHKLKYKEKKPHLISYVFPEETQAGQEPPPLNAQDEEIVKKYKKQCAMKVPKPAIIHKLRFKEKKPHLIPYVFPEEFKKQKKPKAMKKHVDLPIDVEEKPVMTPTVPMLPFHWNKIEEKQLKYTVWYDIYHRFGKQKENQLFELPKLDELFAKPKRTKSKKPNNKSNKKKTNHNIVASEVIVLDKKTRNKMEIFLNRVRMSWNKSTLQICDDIRDMNDALQGGLSQDQIQKLIGIAPNPREVQEFIKSVKGLNPQCAILGKAALFRQELLNVDPCIKDRLILWDFKLSFVQLIGDEEIKTDLLIECIKRIRENEAFKRVLSLALDIGNYVNGGRRHGAAFGFDITTLEKLDQFPRRRNADGSPVPTMLEYIYKLLQQKLPHTLSWTHDLQILNQVIAIDLNVINANVNKFKKYICLLHDRLVSLEGLDPMGAAAFAFVDKMATFHEDSSKKLTAFTQTVDTLNKDLKALSQWFDVDDEDNLEFLKQLNSFRKTFESIGARLMKRQKDEERKAKRQKRLQGESKRKARNSKTSKIECKDIATPVLDRRGTILRTMATAVAQELSTENITGRLRPTSMSRTASINRGGLRNELMKLAASVSNIHE